jgi:hypothetical protein
MDSKRLVALKALTALVATITPGAGYQHDLSVPGAVIRGRRNISKETPLPCVSILEDIDPDRVPSPVGYMEKGRRFKLRLLIQGWAVDDKESPTDAAYNLLADVGKLLWTIQDDTSPNFLLPVVVDGTTYQLVNAIETEAGTVRPPDQTSELAFFWRKVALDMTESTAEPYRLDK